MKAFLRTLIAGLVLAGLAKPGYATESAGPSLLIDAQTGAVISQERAGEPWYPASLTKLMTAYVVFGKIRDGKLALDQQIPVSKLANAQEPSKIGVPPGQTVSVDFALQALLVFSANDMAYVLAEAAGGSAGDFADEMNAAASKLGMSASRFVNPNGLFDPRQTTSARDMAVLAQRIIAEFPQYQKYFEQDYVLIGKRRLSNRNSLLRAMPEADGMKTGFVCNSGFNLVASASRNGRRLIAVVLGTRSGYARAQLAQLLLESGFARPAAGQLQAVASLANLTSPDGQIADMTARVCPRKHDVLLANTEKFQGHAVALGFFDTIEAADSHLRKGLTEARGLELSGMGGVLQMPNAGKYAALVWGLSEDDGEAYCEVKTELGHECRVFDPAFLTALAASKALEAPKAPVIQGSDEAKKTITKAKRKIKPARRIKKVMKARRKRS